MSCKNCFCEKVCKYNDGVNEYCKVDNLCPYIISKDVYIKTPCNIYRIEPDYISDEKWKFKIIKSETLGVGYNTFYFTDSSKASERLEELNNGRT